MFNEIVDEPGERTVEELEAAYAGELADVVDEHGVETVAERASVPASTVEAARAGELDDVTLEEAAAILALREDVPPAEDVVTISLDALMLGMSSAVLDVEAVESGLEGRMEAREIQQKVEGRFPVSLAEYALLYQYVESQY